MGDPTAIEARVHGPKSRWKTATEVSRDAGIVKVLYQGRFYNLTPACVRLKTRKPTYKEG